MYGAVRREVLRGTQSRVSTATVGVLYSTHDMVFVGEVVFLFNLAELVLVTVIMTNPNRNRW